MPPRWRTSVAAPRREAFRFAAAWGLLMGLPFLPALLTPLPRSPYFPLCVEALVLGTAVVYAARTRWDGAARVGAGLGLALLLLYEAYDATVYAAFRRNGILYEDLQFADDLGYLLLNLWSWKVGGGLVLGLVALGAVGLLVRWSLHTLARTGRYGGCRAVLLAAHLVAWPLVGVVGPALELGPVTLTYQSSGERTRVRTASTRALANVQASFRLGRMLDSLRTAPADSAYAAYDTLSLGRRPPVYLIMMESYGAALNVHPALRGPYRALMRKTDSVFAADGWYRATAWGDVPVRGGRSWLSIATLFTGTRVEHQLLYNQFQDTALRDSTQIPHLVRFFNRQGYRTVGLQPFTFARPGLPVHNLYGFDAPVYRDDLNYRGPDYGLANAPDQYSLHYTHETHLAPAQAPFFLFFETVDSHSLWNYGLPPVPSDWRQFNDQTTARRSPHPDTASFPPVFLPDSITAPVIYDQPTPLRYLRHVAHEWRILRDYLTAKAPPGSLVLILGDHQPPLLETTRNTVPLHVLSRDSTLVDRVRRQGFTEGLRPTDQSPRLRQESLYAFLVRLLAAHDRGGPSPDTSGLPPQQPTGVSPSLLLP